VIAANAQKNSDITKAEIEAKLTGEISSHSHAGGGGSGTSDHSALTNRDSTVTEIRPFNSNRRNDF
jgi:hypothetical protein